MANHDAPPKKRHRRGCLLLLLAPLLVMVGVVMTADYLNIPLLPFDLLNPMGSVQVKCSVAGVAGADLPALLRKAKGITVEVLTSQGMPFKSDNENRYATDLNGELKVYLPRGVYRFMIYFEIPEGEHLVRYQLSSRDGSLEVKARQSLTTVEVELQKLEQENQAEVMARIETSLREGKIAEAQAMAAYLQANRNPSAADQASSALLQRLLVVNEKVRVMTEQLDAASKLPLDAYASRIAAYGRVFAAYRSLVPDQEAARLQVVWQSEPINLRIRLNGLEQVREHVIRTHLDNMKQFLDIKMYEAALERWIMIVQDPELYNNAEGLSEPLQQELSQLDRDRLPGLKSKVSEMITGRLADAKKNYDDGKLDEAWKNFGFIKRRIALFAELLQVSDEWRQELADYMADIATINQANHAAETGQYAAALDLYHHVIHSGRAIALKINALEAKTR